MITIDQLLESVDLDFEPRWVTKNKNGGIYVWEARPTYRSGIWMSESESVDSYIAYLKMAEFEGKCAEECIYEVPRKPTGKIEKLEPLNGLQHNWLDKINELVDAVNELKGAKNE